jgi:hypothetical protein
VKGGQTRVDWAPRNTSTLQNGTRADRRRVCRTAAAGPGRQGPLPPRGRRKGSGPRPCLWPLAAQCTTKRHVAVSTSTPTLRRHTRPRDIVASATEQARPPSRRAFGAKWRHPPSSSSLYKLFPSFLPRVRAVVRYRGHGRLRGDLPVSSHHRPFEHTTATMNFHRNLPSRLLPCRRCSLAGARASATAAA